MLEILRKYTDRISRDLAGSQTPRRLACIRDRQLIASSACPLPKREVALVRVQRVTSFRKGIWQERCSPLTVQNLLELRYRNSASSQVAI